MSNSSLQDSDNVLVSSNFILICNLMSSLLLELLSLVSKHLLDPSAEFGVLLLQSRSVSP